MNQAIRTQRISQVRRRASYNVGERKNERSKELEDAVVKLLDAKGLRYMRVDNYRCFKCGQVQNSKAKGHPDFEVYSPHFYIECKTGTGKLTKDQREIKKLIEDVGIKYITVKDNVDEVLSYLEKSKYIKMDKLIPSTK